MQAQTTKECQSLRVKIKRYFKKLNAAKRLKDSIPLYVLMLPAIVYLILFHYVPLYGVQIAFKDFSPNLGITGSPWAPNHGFYYFIRFFQSARFWDLVKNTLTINLLQLVLAFPFPIILALALNYCNVKWFKKSVQMITYAPHFISVVVLVSLINLFLSPGTGFINRIVVMLGGTPVNYMAIPKLFKYIFVASGIWQGVGWSSIIYIGALTTVGPDLHEAAIIDGASKFQRIWNIDLPSISPTIIILFIMQIGKLLDLGFQKVYLMQNGSNLSASEVISTYVYKVGIIQSNYSYSTAIGLFNTAINLLLLFAANRICKKLSGSSLF